MPYDEPWLATLRGGSDTHATWRAEIVLGAMARTPLGGPFRRLWTGAAVSNVGDGLVIVAMPLLAEDLTRHHSGTAQGSAVLVTGIVAMRFGAWLLLGLIGGVVADRVD